MRISMAGDDCALHFDLERLTEKQLADHMSNQVLTGMLQVALLYIAKPVDQVCLYDAFLAPPWREALNRYHAMFVRLGLGPLNLDRVSFHPRDDFYRSVSLTPSDTELENLYMISHSNVELHGDPSALLISQNLNSKVHFARHAPDFGIEVPATLHCKKANLASTTVSEFLAKHGFPLMLKNLGLAGARNVTSIQSLDEADAYLEDYDETLDVILQEKLSTDEYLEMTVDLFVSDTDIHVTNVRQIMFADGLWVGNLLGHGVHLPEAHEQRLLALGEYARHHGYRSQIGYNLGIDYFVRKPTASVHKPELVVTEINARWTGGLFPAELVKRLACGDRQVVAFIDMCPPRHFDDYLEFLEANLHDPVAPRDWSIAPMGFAPFPTLVDGDEILFVWQIVIGDFEAFKQALTSALAPQVLPTAPIISVAL